MTNIARIQAPAPPFPHFAQPHRFDAEVAAVRGAVERVVLELITGAKSSPDIKRALLSHSPQLAAFFGRRDINDVLLPLLITCLNAGSWQLRGAFFGAVAGIGPYGGRDSLDVFLLPCLEQVGGCCDWLAWEGLKSVELCSPLLCLERLGALTVW